MFRRFIGIAMFIAGLLGVLVAIGGSYGTHLAFKTLQGNLDSSLTGAADTVGIVVRTLENTKQTLGDVNTSITTISALASNAAVAIEDTQPLLIEVRQVATEDIPASLDDVRNALPNVASAAKTIDTTLTTLSALPPINIPIVNLNFDLGIDYAPTVSFDESINQIGANLDDIPDRLRGLAPTLETTQENLQVISGDIRTLSTNLDTINVTVGKFQPLLDEYINLLETTQTSLGGFDTNQLNMVKWGIIGLLCWFGLTQLAPIYLGSELMRGRRLYHPARDLEIDEEENAALQQAIKEKE